MYSGKENHYEDFAAERQTAYELGLHSSDGNYAQLTLTSAGTRLSLEFAKGEWSGLTARLRIIEPGEMLFRLLLIVEAGFLPVDDETADAASAERPRMEFEAIPATEAYRMPSEAYAQWRSQHFCFAASPTPTAANAYAELGHVKRDLEERGWLFRPDAQQQGGWAVFRFPGDPKIDVRFSVGQDTDRDRARAAARARLETADDLLGFEAEKAGAGDPPTLAIRDVMAWNTVWDDANSRPYTCLTRSWVRHLGGWGIWLSDVLYNALLNARAGDSYMARENLRAVFAGQQPAGNLPCLLAGFEEWVDRTQLPIASYITWRVYLLTGDRTLLEESYGTLRRYYAWFAAYRDGNQNGLFEYGSTPTGHAHNTHTKQGAMNESGMDNMPIFDDVVFNPSTNTLEFEEPGHNSLLALEGEMLARIARELGHHADADALEQKAAALRELISTQLWDPAREIFAGRFWSGEFASQLSPTSFFPLVAGAATPTQAETLIEKHLLNEQEFWGPLPLPSTPFDDPVSQENSYWRGRIWPPLNYFTWEGLRRNGETQLAHELADRTWEMFRAEWESNRHCHENFHIRDPKLHDSPDSDPFYSWGALIPLMRACEAADVSPWDGLSLGGQNGEDSEIGTPGRRFSTRRNGEWMDVTRNDELLFRITPPTRITHLEAEGSQLQFRLSPSNEPPYIVEVPSTLVDVLASVRVDGDVKEGLAAEDGMLRLSVASEVQLSIVGDVNAGSPDA